MKNRILPALLVAGVAMPAVAQPTIYGKINASLQSASEGDESTTELVSNASRIGVKGSIELDNGMEAIYQAEYETFVDDGEKADNETFSQRNIFFGIKGDFGLVKAGKFDTPLKTAQKKVDLFNDLEGDIKNLLTVHDNRSDNIVSYTTPSLGAVKGTVAYVAKEDENVDDGVSVLVNYEQDGLYLAAAFDQNVEAEDVDVLRLVAQYNLDNLQLGAIYETTDSDALAEDVDVVFFSVKYKIDKFALKAQYGQTDFQLDGESLSLGVDYKLAKKVKLFTYYTQLESDSGTDNDYLGVGAELKF